LITTSPQISKQFANRLVHTTDNVSRKIRIMVWSRPEFIAFHIRRLFSWLGQSLVLGLGVKFYPACAWEMFEKVVFDG
jgi:hypothetical protein